jgi:hypothetical protein
MKSRIWGRKGCAQRRAEKSVYSETEGQRAFKALGLNREIILKCISQKM